MPAGDDSGTSREQKRQQVCTQMSHPLNFEATSSTTCRLLPSPSLPQGSCAAAGTECKAAGSARHHPCWCGRARHCRFFGYSIRSQSPERLLGLPFAYFIFPVCLHVSREKIWGYFFILELFGLFFFFF